MSDHDTVVVGLGSIGVRHLRVLRGMGRRVATVSRRGSGDFADLGAALTPDVGYVVVANETAEHGKALTTLARAGFAGTVLVEKPIVGRLRELPSDLSGRIYTGYNLRFHPVLSALAATLQGERPLMVEARVGQHISGWRPGRDVSATASATRAAGGGVLRDLSHELDYLTLYFGRWRRVAALGGEAPEIGVESEAFAAVLLELEGCGCVAVHLDYLDRVGRRRIRVLTASRTIEADLVAGTLTIDGVTRSFPVERDDTYLAMHAAAIDGSDEPCDARHGLAVVGLVEAIERAMAQKTWVAA